VSLKTPHGVAKCSLKWKLLKSPINLQQNSPFSLARISQELKGFPDDKHRKLVPCYVTWYSCSCL